MNVSLAFAIEVIIDPCVRYFSWIPIKRCDFIRMSSSHARMCIRSIMHSCITLEFCLPFLFGKNCSSVQRFDMSHLVCFVEEKIILLFKNFRYQLTIFNLHCTRDEDVCAIRKRVCVCRDRALLYYTEKRKKKKQHRIVVNRYANTAIFPAGEGLVFSLATSDIFIHTPIKLQLARVITALSRAIASCR